VDDRLRVRTRTGRKVSDSLPELTGLVEALDGHRVILDGELVASVDGKVDFYRLAPRMTHTGRRASWAARQVRVTFVAFDLLHLDGQDLTGLPLVERKQQLDDLHMMGPAWITNGWYPGDGDSLFQVCVELGHEDHATRRRPRIPA
jgi:bifunctional non-homologous end joining protein LigD